MLDPVFDPTAADIDQARRVLDAHDRNPRACRHARCGRHCKRLAMARGLVLIDAALAPTDS